jgi:N-acetylneuraminic acid mutarotase
VTDGSVNDTWAYDPAANTWTELHSNTLNGSYPADDSPYGGFGPTTVYDPGSRKAILFGEEFGDDIWTYDPATNTSTPLRTAGDLPDSRFAYSVVYDSGKGKVILFGGTDGGLGPASDIWTYDPAATRWTKRDPGGDRLPVRIGQSVVYDPVGRKAILFGGFDEETGEVFNDTWAYDPAANTWAELHPQGELPPARGFHAMVYDSVSGRVILFWRRRS